MQKNNAGSYYFYLTFSIRATATTEPGENINDAYAIWDNNRVPAVGDTVQQVQVYTRPAPDAMDLDNDSNTAELVAYASNKFDFVPPAELIIYKSVRGNLDSTFVSSGGKSYIGGPATYRVTVMNKTKTPVTSATVLDVLPSVGDYNIAPDINDIFAPRGSSFPVVLTGPVTGGGATANFAIYYNPTAKGATQSPEDYAAGNGWVSGEPAGGW